MIVGTMLIELHAPWVHSLKEKRMIVKSICGKAGNKFNISIAEVDKQDRHQAIVLGISCVTDEMAHANSILDNVLNFIEEHTEAEVISVYRELL
ncbi:DUF503 domain-containing protein [Aminipila luticellarii]|uniref:DUF503 domain-containing protein n=1 Tax=Aminipila luticellarii TaxID=2507160 RepID=A0A410PY31_9FIRM|nr:DUF503 domain-containing protein [Aminipila luticellarii]QAT43853.1 DUF503 domain-containing protein [Aminipila luticellarii]